MRTIYIVYQSDPVMPFGDHIRGLGVETEQVRPWGRDTLDPDLLPARLLDSLIEMIDLQEFLSELPALALRHVRGSRSASIIVLHPDEEPIFVASDEMAATIDKAQYRDGHGPALSAAMGNDAVLIDLAVDRRDRHMRWRQAAADAGVTTVLSLPIIFCPHVAASLNLYAIDDNGWSGDAVNAAETVTDHISNALTLAYRLTRHDPYGLYAWPYLR